MRVWRISNCTMLRSLFSWDGSIYCQFQVQDIATLYKFLQANKQSELPSLLGDPMTAQADIVLKNIILPSNDIPDYPPLEKSDEPRLLGRPIRKLSLAYVQRLGSLMAMLSEKNMSKGILGMEISSMAVQFLLFFNYAKGMSWFCYSAKCKKCWVSYKTRLLLRDLFSSSGKGWQGERL